MKRVLSLVATAGFVLFLAHFLRAPVPLAGAMGGAGTPSGNGDVNGDGALNITDAVYLLQHLFQGGPAPVPIVTKAAGLPATGQTKCYDGAIPAIEIPCNSADFPGQDGFYQSGCPMAGRFVDNGDGTVTDNCTGLMWQKEIADTNGNGTSGDEDRPDWREALRYCEALSFAGHDDWRLPNVRELQSIVDYGRGFPAIDPIFGEVGTGHWSSTTAALYLEPPGQAWFVWFWDGEVFAHVPGVHPNCVVRAVRNAP
jgi:hypothetical protein